ncbi:unnamed protein product [Timema podura]|uniref:Uncharacterized protein n=1 Tax=Timema podura TaxID=61482 RepID=A0ABN7P3N3_TIMPD|nr:unnamed protein product [Timema podura]
MVINEVEQIYLGSVIEEKGGSKEDLMRREQQGELLYRWLGCALGRDDDAARHEDGPEEDTCLHVTDEETEVI